MRGYVKMEYMEQQMQQQIEAGINEADRCYARIAELEEQSAALAAQVETVKSLFSLNCLVGCDGILHYPVAQYNKVVDALNAAPQQHLAEIRAQAVIDAVVSHEVKYGNSQFGRHLREYADSIRRGEVSK